MPALDSKGNSDIYMKSVSKKVVQNTFFILTGRIASLLFNMITVVVLARTLGEETFGVFSYSLVFVGFFSLLPNFGMKPIIVREVSRNRSNADVLLGHALFAKLSFSIIAIILINLSAVLFFSDGTLRHSLFVLSFILLLSSKLDTVRIVFESPFYADMDMKYPVLFELLDSFLQLLWILVFVFLKAPYNHLLLAYVFAHIPGLGITLFLSWRRIRPRIVFMKKKMFWLFKEASPLFFYLVFSMIFNRLDVLFLKSMYGERMVGIYSAAFRLTVPLSFIPIAIATALYPLMSKARMENGSMLPTAFTLGSKVLLALGLCMGVFGMLIGKSLFVFLYGDRFAEAVLPFQLLLWSQAFVFATYFLVDFNNSQNAQKKNTLSAAVMLAVSFFLNWILIARFVAVGAGMAKIVLDLTGFFVLYQLSRSVVPVNSIKIFLNTAGVLLVLLFISTRSFFDSLHFGWKVCFSGIFMSVFLMRLFSREETMFLKKTLRSFLAKPVLLE